MSKTVFRKRCPVCKKLIGRASNGVDPPVLAKHHTTAKIGGRGPFRKIDCPGAGKRWDSIP